MKSVPRIIAEIANTHEGSIEVLLETVDATASTGVPAIKFQLIVADELVHPRAKQYQIFRDLEFPKSEWNRVFERAKSLELDIWLDVFGLRSFALIQGDNRVTGFKIHTSDIQNFELIKEIAAEKKPVLLSCSGSNDLEIARVVSLLQSESENLDITLMHGFQNYPTALENTNLSEIKRLSDRFDLPIGIMDHNDAEATEAMLVPIVASTMNVAVVEKHITLERSLKRADYYSSLNPDEFRKMVNYVHGIYRSYGNSRTIKSFSTQEREYAAVARKRFVASSDIAKGQKIKKEHVTLVRNDDPICSLNLDDIVGEEAIRPISAGKTVRRADLPAAVSLLVTFGYRSGNRRRSYGSVLKQLALVASRSEISEVNVAVPNSLEFDELAESLGQQDQIKVLRMNEQGDVRLVLESASSLQGGVIVHVESDAVEDLDFDSLSSGVHSFLNSNAEFEAGSGFSISSREFLLELKEIIGSIAIDPRTSLKDLATTLGVVGSSAVENQSPPPQSSNLSLTTFLRSKSAFPAEPIVTVYMPAYNCGDFIRQAIESVLKQTFRDWELVIINDGSQDKTEEIVSLYAGDARIKIINQENRGLTRSSNLAISLARGEYIMRLDADDYLDEHALTVLTDKFRAEPSLDMVYPDYYRVSESGELLNTVRQPRLGREIELLDNPAHGACTMIRLSSLKSVGGYNEEIDREDEFDLWIRCHRRFHIDNVNLPLFYYRQRQSSLTADQERIRRTKAAVLREGAEKAFVEMGDRPKSIGVIPVRAKGPLGHHAHLLKVGGETLLANAIRSADSVFDDLIVTSEDPEVLKHAKRCSSAIRTILRPERLGRQNVEIWRTLQFVLEQTEASASPYFYTGLTFIEFPFRDSQMLEQGLHTLSVFEVDGVVDVVSNRNDFYRRGRVGLEKVSDQSDLRLERKELLENPGAMVFGLRENLKDPKSPYGTKTGHVRIPAERAFKICELNDIEVAEVKFRQLANARTRVARKPQKSVEAKKASASTDLAKNLR